VYDRHVSKFVGKNVRILEIGVGAGGSLQMWREYFGKKSKVYGLDINSECKDFEGAGIEILIGDQGNKECMESVADILRDLDLVIDDGGHYMHQQKITFDTLFPIINDGGVYVCEDTNTSYDKNYGGGRKRQDSFIEHVKNLIDSQNHMESKLYGIHFYPWMVVIEKRQIVPQIVRMGN